MKKILWLCPLMLLIMAFIGCDDKEKDDDEGLGGQLSETTWAAVSLAQYLVLSDSSHL